MKRELFYQDDRSNKFWTVEVVGSVVLITYGRIGARPRETRKQFDDASAAEREAAKLAAAKLREGYVEGAIANAPAYEKPRWAEMTMDEPLFWRIIKMLDWKKTGDDDAVLKPAVAALSQMPKESIERFDELLAVKLHALDTEAHARSIGEHAYQGEKSHFAVDLFLYARCVVVANGEAFYRTVLANPTSMPKDMEFEAILTLAAVAYEKKTGEPFEHVSTTSYETFSNESGWKA